jgi:hypothetical protein
MSARGLGQLRNALVEVVLLARAALGGWGRGHFSHADSSSKAFGMT